MREKAENERHEIEDKLKRIRLNRAAKIIQKAWKKHKKRVKSKSKGKGKKNKKGKK